ncbi:response regulator [Labrys okinawensis]|uniref:response regulator n=1 Tax=Labrys okinawensis TaxID=346911 RepID=UPI0039BD34DB
MAGNDRKTILVIEDERMVQMLVVDILNDLGYSTLEARDANTALPILESGQTIDLMVTDIGLPGMSGWDLARRARESRPALKILFLTGYENEQSPELDRDGSHDVMAKPFDMSAFEAKITDMMAQPLEKNIV